MEVVLPMRAPAMTTMVSSQVARTMRPLSTSRPIWRPAPCSAATGAALGSM